MGGRRRAALGGPAFAQAPADKYKLDADRFRFTRVEDDAPVRSEGQNREEYEAYNDVLLHARQFPAAELESHANRDVTFLDLVRPIRQDFQFQLLYFEGRLAKLRRVEPNRGLAAAGVDRPVRGVDVPRQRVGPDVRADHRVAARTGAEPGVRPQAAGRRRRVLLQVDPLRVGGEGPARPDPLPGAAAPLLMAKSFTLLPTPDADGGRAWRTGFLPGMLGVLAGIVVVAAVLTLLFRRGDRAARRAIEDRRARNPFDGGPEPTNTD